MNGIGEWDGNHPFFGGMRPSCLGRCKYRYRNHFINPQFWAHSTLQVSDHWFAQQLFIFKCVSIPFVAIPCRAAPHFLLSDKHITKNNISNKNINILKIWILICIWKRMVVLQGTHNARFVESTRWNLWMGNGWLSLLLLLMLLLLLYFNAKQVNEV